MSAVPIDQLSNEEKDELCCTYAALILRDDKADITAENIQKLVKASGNTVEAYWPSLFARLCTARDVGDMLSSTGGAAGGPVAAAAEGGAATGGAAAAGEAKKEEVEEEEEEDMEFDLFG
eukprot:GEMP01133878.1.p1 GENE.GEMP01133878.1~~GEMP01133878.1.p1  ORF type:complete len:133 (+),score=43.01 GEMP01133878.1:40-399(+)